MLSLDELWVRWPWPTAESDKYSRGVVGIDTGSDRFPGAAVLNCLGASYSGAGFIRFAGLKRSADLVLHRLPNVTLGVGRSDVWLVGSGWGEPNPRRFNRALATGAPLVVDAEALQQLVGSSSGDAETGSHRVKLPAGSLLTPHAGELARLLDCSREEVVADPIKYAAHAAESFQVTVLIKGAENHCVAPSGEVITAIPGPNWTAQAGSGDVLAGICATLIAAGVDALHAGAMAASVQALAVARLDGPYPPGRIAEEIATVISRL